MLYFVKCLIFNKKIFLAFWLIIPGLELPKISVYHAEKKHVFEENSEAVDI